MAGNNENTLSGPDLKAGISFASLKDSEPLLGHFDGEPVTVVRVGEQVFATGATCTHYSGPLAEGVVVGKTIRCPWHHARFSLKTGEAIGAPALDPVSCFEITRKGDTIAITGKKAVDFRSECKSNPASVVVVGTGAAGTACADKLRTKGYTGPVTMIGDDEPGPIDRPNLSKDFLAGTAPEEWTQIRTPEKVDVVTGDPAVRIDVKRQEVQLRSGRKLKYGALLLATGAEPRSLPIPGADLPHVHRLRSLGDSKAIIQKAEKSKSCAVIGSSFIGLEVAASLRHRGVGVSVIGQDAVPLGKILGEEVGRFVQGLHEEQGVQFCLNSTPKEIREKSVLLSDGRSVDADLVVLGVGVTPRTSLAETAGLEVQDGVVVDGKLRTGAPDVYAAGDIARFPERLSGARTRIEHWVVAERQGQAVARSMLGMGGEFCDTPFFWSQHYDVQISYVGHAEKWDRCEVLGDLAKRDACAIYRCDGRAVAVVTIGRDQVSLRVEAAMESEDAGAVDAVLRG